MIKRKLSQCETLPGSFAVPYYIGAKYERFLFCIFLTEDKLRRLASFFSSKSFDEIDMTFSFPSDLNVDNGYFCEMMAGAVTFHFGIDTDASTIEGFSTLQDIADYIASRSYDESKSSSLVPADMAPIGHIPLVVFAFVIAFHVGVASGTDIIGQCSDADKMTNSVRKAFLIIHNKLRSQVARGKVTGKYGPVPKAARMLKMVYDCKIEETAMRHAKKCKFQHSKKSERPGLGENIYQSWGMKKTFEESANVSSKWWFSEVKDPGMPMDNVFTREIFNGPKQIAHYTQPRKKKIFWHVFGEDCAMYSTKASDFGLD
ncbi:unnamed protein product [Nippostrongylus brasiliensis]|uniref:SCP domain-containing protein n=1 Tax=Nippostrongylus brasiliensis TaxID=27835 RepID=A0A0N4YHA4_NIPBR|nr:unnamed protein product [Nippostrongylus brasiliensis]